MHNFPTSSPPCSEQLLITPQELIRSQPLNGSAKATIDDARYNASRIIHGEDNRLLVVIGPCSIHDTHAALEYGTRLKAVAEKLIDDLYIIMRVYFEKPRTTIGWKGLIRDPELDGSFAMNEGLKQARKLLIELNMLGVPAGTEFLDTLIPAYLSDLVAWCAIGARTVESQIHRELASGLSMPVGFKNTMEGNVKAAIDAVKVAQLSHPFLSITQTGIPAIRQTAGNSTCHIILRGSHTVPNYTATSIQQAAILLEEAQLRPKIMVDCSHGNSMKDYQRQHVVIHDLINQIKKGSTFIQGVMIESNLVAGKQVLQKKEALVYGQSVTDGCIGWEETIELLEKLAIARAFR